MTRGSLSARLVILLLGVTAAGCTQTATSPTAPVSAGTAATRAATDAAADGSTLKASAPAITSPAQGQEIDEKTMTIVVGSARGTYVDAALDLEIEVWKGSVGGGTLVDSTIRPQQAGSTSFTPAGELEGETQYLIRARARLADAFGPWSPVVTVTTIAFVVTPAPGSFGNDQINPFEVVYLHRNIAAWEQTSLVTGLTISSGQICVYHTGAGTFPQSIFGDIFIEGNIWVFAPINGVWYGATWDWLRPGQECKGEGLRDLGPDQIRKPPMDHTWNPAPGTPVCFAMSARARDEVEAGEVRTNIACTTVP
ncbi:MAG: hypothetical protein HY701_04680 [Gemmatimonadetes bacterium]|nr:hypothetical protein [Gemmatimonadota bacterium]